MIAVTRNDMKVACSTRPRSTRSPARDDGRRGVRTSGWRDKGTWSGESTSQGVGPTRMINRILRGLATCGFVALSGCSSAPAEGTEAVMVIHGLGRTPASMAILGTRLESEGFRVVRFGYASTSEPIDVLADHLKAEVERCCAAEAETAHFVTHSMGGVLLRAYLAQQPRPHRGRVVMLSPPSQGSEIVDAFTESRLLRSLLDPSGSRLGTAGPSHREATAVDPIQFGDHHRRSKPESSGLVAHSRAR